MPVRNLFKNCSYYWGFAAFVAYFLNHPLYTPPNPTQTYIALALAMVWQLANFRWGPLPCNLFALSNLCCLSLQSCAECSALGTCFNHISQKMQAYGPCRARPQVDLALWPVIPLLLQLLVVIVNSARSIRLDMERAHKRLAWNVLSAACFETV